MLDEVQDQIRAWLDGEPTLSALEVLARLKSTRPEQFSDRHLRTVQRAVKAWRGHQARRIILESSTALAAARSTANRTRHPPGSPLQRHETIGNIPV